MFVVVGRETGLGRYREPLADGLSAPRAPGPFLGFCAARHILAAAVLVAPATAMTPTPPRHSVVLLAQAPHSLRRGAQRVVPVLGAGRGPLAHDGLAYSVTSDLHLHPC